METPRTDRHPEVADRLADLEADGRLFRAHQFSVAENRRQVDRTVESLGWLDDPAPVGRVRDYHVAVDGGEMPLRLYTPEGDGPFPTLVWFHGGGWVRDSIDGTDPIARALAAESGCAVLSAGYRLAPEHPFPTGLEDCYRALEWADENRVLVFGAGEPLAVGGTSAGGNLAVATALMARDRDGPEIDHHVSVVPVLDRPRETESYRENTDGFGPTAAEMAWFWDHYLDRAVDARHPYAAPLQARDLGGLPPATVVTAGFDALRDDGIAYVDRLDAAGVPVTHHHYPDMPHHVASSAFHYEDVGRARDAVSTLADGLEEALAAPGR